MKKVYKVKRSITFPLLIAVLLSIPVFVFSVQGDAATAKLIWTFILMLLFYGFALNKIMQAITLTPDELEFRGILGRRIVKTTDITAIEGASMGTRQFIVISSATGSQHFSNSLDGFAELATSLKTMTPSGIQGSGLNDITQSPLINRRDALAPWIAVLVLSMLLLGNFSI